MKYRSLLAILMVLMMIFAVSCVKTDNGPPDNQSSVSTNNNSSSEPSSDSSEDSASLPSSSNEESSSVTDSLPENSDTLDVSSDVFNSSEETDGSDISSSEDFGGDNSGDADFTDMDALYKSPIQQTGTSTGNSIIRNINVKTSNTVFKNFLSFGANINAGILTKEGIEKTGMNSVYFEIEKKRYMSAKPQISRFHFPVGNIVTNTEPNPSREDYENNADYINYKNGVYDFESDAMQANYQYLDILKACGGKVYINFGYTNETRIQSWFCLRDDAPNQSAPADTTLFVKACIASLEELVINRGYDNIIGVSFFNEPNSSNHFEAIGSKPAYYVSIIKKTAEALKKSKLNGKIQIFGAEVSNIRINNRSFIDYLFDNSLQYLKAFTAHNYFSSIAKPDEGVTEPVNYDFNYKLGSFVRNFYKTPIYFGEFNTGSYDYNEEITGTKVDKAEGGRWTWETSNAAYFISCANSGIGGAARWSYSGQYWPDPAGWGSYENNYHSLYLCPLSLDAVENGVLDKYYEDSLLTNYVKAGSDVLYVDWTGEDTRVSAFKLPDGNYTVIVEVNDAKQERKINLNFDKALGKTLYRMSFSHNVKNTGNATVQPCDKKFDNVGKSITDNVGVGYAYYVYTTCPPIKQVELNKVTAEISAGETVQFTTKLVDCPSNEEIVWSISSEVGGHKGSVNQRGLYIAATDAIAGDMVAVRASLKSDPTVYSVAIIKIK